MDVNNIHIMKMFSFFQHISDNNREKYSILYNGEFVWKNPQKKSNRYLLERREGGKMILLRIKSSPHLWMIFKLKSFAALEKRPAECYNQRRTFANYCRQMIIASSFQKC